MPCRVRILYQYLIITLHLILLRTEGVLKYNYSMEQVLSANISEVCVELI